MRQRYRECKRIIREILTAVGHLHANNIIHRDIKPENIMFDMDLMVESSPKTVKLIDFDTCQEWTPQTPKSRRFVGTPGYIAPEALLGQMTPQSDLWSVGVILYILMTGEMPWSSLVSLEDGLVGSPSATQMYRALKAEVLEWEQEPWPDFPLARELCQKLLAFELEDRMKDCEEARKESSNQAAGCPEVCRRALYYCSLEPAGNGRARIHARRLITLSQPLDEPLKGLEEVDELKVHHRDFFGGVGSFTVLHHQHLSHSAMSGSFTSTASNGGVTEHRGCFQGDPCHEGPVPKGPGVRINPDGSSYTGEWKDGFPHGHGEWKAAPPSCESYVGEWKARARDCFEGDWADGKFQDRGKYTYLNGDEFLGLWEKGVKLSGTFYHKDGRISTRKWQNGKLVSCQDFDSRKKAYQPTMTHTQANAPMSQCEWARGQKGRGLFSSQIGRMAAEGANVAVVEESKDEWGAVAESEDEGNDEKQEKHASESFQAREQRLSVAAEVRKDEQILGDTQVEVVKQPVEWHGGADSDEEAREPGEGGAPDVRVFPEAGEPAEAGRRGA
ncbi:unnamed protein product [Effrenium voratum]|nr:unnamed protein product [Effrenium voratum]